MAESRKLAQAKPRKEKIVRTPDEQFVLSNRDTVPLAYTFSSACGLFLEEQDYYHPRVSKKGDSRRIADLIAEEERGKEITAKYNELLSLPLKQVCAELIGSDEEAWKANMLRFAALRGVLRTKIKELSRDVWIHIQRRTYAQASSLTAKSFEEHLEKLELTPADFKGKRVLVLGPGTDFAFEKGIADAGAELVVALSYSFDRHESPDAVHAERPNIYPVRGLFQELPPMDGMFDYILSVHAFPRSVDAMHVTEDKKTDIADIKERYAAAISLLAPLGQYRSYPMMRNESDAAKRLPKKARERVTVEMREKDYSWSPDLLIMTAKGE